MELLLHADHHSSRIYMRDKVLQRRSNWQRLVATILHDGLGWTWHASGTGNLSNRVQDGITDVRPEQQTVDGVTKNSLGRDRKPLEQRKSPPCDGNPLSVCVRFVVRVDWRVLLQQENRPFCTTLAT